MLPWNAYWRLLRLDKPVGSLLLWYPTAWALWLANQGAPSWRLLWLFAAGTVLMRSAGCVINDIADRHVDKHVARTKLRPLTVGEVSLTEAFILLSVLLAGALWILLQLPGACFFWAMIALAITVLYPFCKRYINAPQIVLGLAFSLGIPMAYVASFVPVNRDCALLFFINFLWIVAYDTMYAMTDKEDDLKVGVKSTAIYFGTFDRLIVGLLLMLAQLIWLYWGSIQQVSLWFYFFWSLASIVLLYQQRLIHSRNPKDCFKAFLVSVYYGALMWLAIGVQ